MVEKIYGFELSVRIEDALPRVVIKLAGGETVVDTNRVSATGLRHLSAVFERAGEIAERELGHYYAVLYERQRESRAKNS